MCLSVVEAGHRLPVPSADTPENIVGLIRECTQWNVALRPSMQTVETQLRAFLQSIVGRGIGGGGDAVIARQMTLYNSESTLISPESEESAL